MTLPKPLLPSNVDLQDYTYMPLHVLRLRDSEFTSEVSAEAFRAGVLLWCSAWHQVPCGSLPNNDKTLSNMAGFGRVVSEWEKVKEEALRGWVLCDDGRYYHPVVCEVAMESWLSKQEYNYKKFVDRLRKRNINLKEKNLPSIDIPLIDQWISAGMPSDWGNNSEVIPQENSSNSNGAENNSTGINKNSIGIPAENALKEREENIREDNINKKHRSDPAGSGVPVPPKEPDKPKTKRQDGASKNADVKTLVELGCSEQVANDYLKVRKAKRAPLTETALNDLLAQAKKAGITPADAIRVCVIKSWQSFNAGWVWQEAYQSFTNPNAPMPPLPQAGQYRHNGQPAQAPYNPDDDIPECLREGYKPPPKPPVDPVLQQRIKAEQLKFAAELAAKAEQAKAEREAAHAGTP